MNVGAFIFGLVLLVVLAYGLWLVLFRATISFRVRRAQRMLNRLVFEPAGTCKWCGKQIGSLYDPKRGGRLRWFTEDREALCDAHFPGRATTFGHYPVEPPK